MTKIEVNLNQRTLKRLEQHAGDPLHIDPLIRRAIEQYLARLDKIDADAEYAKAHGHYPEPPRSERYGEYGRELPY